MTAQGPASTSARDIPAIKRKTGTDRPVRPICPVQQTRGHPFTYTAKDHPDVQ